MATKTMATTRRSSKKAVDAVVSHAHDGLSSMQSFMPTAKRVVAHSHLARLFYFDSGDKKWVSRKIDGALYLIERSDTPRLALFIINRIGTENWSAPLSDAVELQQASNKFLLVRQDADACSQIFGVWFREFDDFTRICNVIRQQGVAVVRTGEEGSGDGLGRHSAPATAAMNSPPKPYSFINGPQTCKSVTLPENDQAAAFGSLMQMLKKPPEAVTETALRNKPTEEAPTSVDTNGADDISSQLESNPKVVGEAPQSPPQSNQSIQASNQSILASLAALPGNSGVTQAKNRKRQESKSADTKVAPHLVSEQRNFGPNKDLRSLLAEAGLPSKHVKERPAFLAEISSTQLAKGDATMKRTEQGPGRTPNIDSEQPDSTPPQPPLPTLTAGRANRRPAAKLALTAEQFEAALEHLVEKDEDALKDLVYRAFRPMLMQPDVIVKLHCAYVDALRESVAPTSENSVNGMS